jgi:hypothetical protein
MEELSMDSVTKLWAVEVEMFDGTWEIAENDDTLELFAHEGQARDALGNYQAQYSEATVRLACFTRDAAVHP